MNILGSEEEPGVAEGNEEEPGRRIVVGVLWAA